MMLAFGLLILLTSQSIGKTGKQGKVSKIVPKGKDYQAGVEEERDGPLVVEDENQKCRFTCRKNGACSVGWQKFENGFHSWGDGYCYPRSRRNGTCLINREAPEMCKDCHAAREREKGSSCEEPKPEINCDYSCLREVFCRVRVTKSDSFGTSWRNLPHDHEDIPKKCQGKCLEAHPGCERPKGVTCVYYCDQGQFCRVNYTRNEGGLITTGSVPDFVKSHIPSECHNKCKIEHPDCGWK